MLLTQDPPGKAASSVPTALGPAPAQPQDTGSHLPFPCKATPHSVPHSSRGDGAGPQPALSKMPLHTLWGGPCTSPHWRDTGGVVGAEAAFGRRHVPRCYQDHLGLPVLNKWHGAAAGGRSSWGISCLSPWPLVAWLILDW